MFEIFGIPSQALFGQLLLGLINGSFYALLSLGLAVIFGMLNIINFAHGAQYMMGAFAAYLMLQYLGIGYWEALVVAPILVGATGIVVERLFLQHLRKLDPLYGLLLTFGLALMIEGLFRNYLRLFRPALPGAGRAAAAAAISASCSCRTIAPGSSCFRWRCASATWFAIERTRLGSYLRAATENPVAGARLRHQRAAHGDADLRLRRRARGARRRAWRRRSTTSRRRWAPTSSSWCSPWW